jgi:predicted permease
MRRIVRFELGRSISRDVDDELAFHLQARVEKLVAQGLTPEHARAEAERQFGDLAAVRKSCVTLDQERAKTMRRAELLDQVRQDVVFTVRTLRRNFGLTVVVVASLAVGISANAAIFTLVDAVLLRPLPVPAADQLVVVGDPTRVGAHTNGNSARVDVLSYPLYRDLRDQNRTLSGLAASGATQRLDARIDSTSDDLEHPAGRFVSANYFQVLQVPAARGRVFDGTEDRSPGAGPFAVISDGYRTRRFGAGTVVGRDIIVDGARVTIIGVTPPGFTGEVVGVANDIWIPIGMQPMMQPHRVSIELRGTDWLLLLGRRRAGATIGQVEADLTAVMRRVMPLNPPAGDSPDNYRKVAAVVSSGARGLSSVRAAYGAPLITLTAGVGLLMLIICANVANLLLARAAVRGREMGVRLAIGAGRARIVRQLLTESAILAAISAAGGLVLARWGCQALLTLAADGGPAIAVNTRPDLAVLGYTLGLTVLAVGLFGLFPALHSSRIDLATAMHSRGVTGDLGLRGGHRYAGRLLVAGQVGLSLVLLVCAGLLVRSLQRVDRTEAGLDRDHLVILSVDAVDRSYRGPRLGQLLRDLTDRFRRVNAVAAVTFSQNGIFSGIYSTVVADVPGFVASSEADNQMDLDLVGPGYARAIGATLVKGRDIAEEDRPATASVAVVNETFARFYFGSSNPLGRTIKFDPTVTTTIVGVVADVRDHSLTQPPVRRVYASYLQQIGVPGNEPSTAVFEIRTTGETAPVLPGLRRAVASVDPTLPVASAAPLSTLIYQSVSQERLLSRVATGFGVLALVLAAAGLYGTMTYSVNRRFAEIGLRMALGAERGDIVRFVVRDALTLVALGVAAGIPLAFAATRLLTHQLRDVGTADPAALAVALGVLTASALTAAWLPARRAARVSPVEALRAE